MYHLAVALHQEMLEDFEYFKKIICKKKTTNPRIIVTILSKVQDFTVSVNVEIFAINDVHLFVFFKNIWLILFLKTDGGEGWGVRSGLSGPTSCGEGHQRDVEVR